MLQLLEGVEGVKGPLADGDVADVVTDSRKVTAGALFVALRGEKFDGHQFAEAALAAGARLVVAETPAPPGVAWERWAEVRDSRRALGVIAANAFGRPGDELTLVGITGTKGKTTLTYLVESLIGPETGRAGVIGTVNYRYGDTVVAAPHTTPEPVTLQSLLREMASAGTTHVAMEVSSHALEQARVVPLLFRVGAFTNLAHDHLDYHGDQSRYIAAKRRLFLEHLDESGVAVVNADDARAAEVVRGTLARLIRVSLRDRAADVVVVRSLFGGEGLRAEIQTPRGLVRLRSHLMGEFNLQNIALAVGVGVALELSLDQIRHGIERLRGVPGRLERIENTRDVTVLVDYAHTENALRSVLAALRPTTRRRLIVVFGCGGDRDRLKRPLMGRAAMELADLVVVTSDNPRTEEPAAIISEIVPGVESVGRPALDADAFVKDSAIAGYTTEVDRRAAIRLVARAARPGDVVLIAGKGHEDYQIVGAERTHFDDREEARAAFGGTI
ncbi:MAG: UDP-N-acetylmuramoyl-L-alanyl-D-glutamate--2,6-diaminopimelate ligase [Deltaproteobacteria bacterium]|nr:UDP-N-acetylmuramoyl-L-alanyl-D-glutamate--2,6-diaminopimelate ligase [Deltaproteobacteria bacterium]